MAKPVKLEDFKLGAFYALSDEDAFVFAAEVEHLICTYRDQRFPTDAHGRVLYVAGPDEVCIAHPPHHDDGKKRLALGIYVHIPHWTPYTEAKEEAKEKAKKTFCWHLPPAAAWNLAKAWARVIDLNKPIESKPTPDRIIQIAAFLRGIESREDEGKLPIIRESLYALTDGGRVLRGDYWGDPERDAEDVGWTELELPDDVATDRDVK